MFIRRNNKLMILLIGLMFCGMLAGNGYAGEEKDPAREKLLADKSLLFFAPFDFSVDAEQAAHHKTGNLNGEGEFIPGVVGNCISLPEPGKGAISYNFSDNIDMKAGTMMFWFKPHWWGDELEEKSFRRCLMWLRLSDGKYFAFYRTFSRKASPYAVYMIYQNYGTLISTRAWKKDQWVHLAATWDMQSDKYIIYVNGRQALSAPVQWKDKEIEGRGLSLGRYYGVDVIDAAYDEFFVFGRSLTAEEIKSYYDATNPAD
ncbi:MAG: hypothetical protein PHO05_07670 [bacterium]|nr:hypothetical protein [bacterium]